RSPGIVWPQSLPGGKSLLVFDENASRWGNARVLDLATRELTDIAPSALSPRYLPTGHLLYVDTTGTLFAVPFDPAIGRISGSPLAAVKDVAISANESGAFAVSDSGSLVYATGYIRGSARELTRLVRVDRAGEIAPLPLDADLFGRSIRISPDGRRLAVTSWDFNLWIYDLERHSRIRLPNTHVSAYDGPVWTTDGGRVAFGGAKVGEPGWKIYLQKADGTEEPEAVVAGNVAEKYPFSFAPGGELLYEILGDGIWVLGSGGRDAPRRLLAGAGHPMVSPDGRWLAYSSIESGVLEVYVQKYPELGHN